MAFQTFAYIYYPNKGCRLYICSVFLPTKKQKVSKTGKKCVKVLFEKQPKHVNINQQYFKI